MTGTVYLVGAGPGDPALLTVRAAELLAGAEVVAYDELVSPEILARIPADAERLAVGRRAGHCPTPEIHPGIVQRALEGKAVVRLKAGDPLVFGRGGEEAAVLRASGIPFEIVPGITAALGAAAYGGIPLTHRRLASTLTFVTGHPAAAGAPRVDWDALARGGGTLVLYMASRDLVSNLGRLVAGGRDPFTPAAIAWAATTPRQRVLVGTLQSLAELTAGVTELHGEPAVVVVGEVAALHAELAWFRSGPLGGKTILVARTKSAPSRLSSSLRSLGARVVEAPTVTVESAADLSYLDEAIASHADHDGIVFASPAAVAAWLTRLSEKGIDRRSLPMVGLWAAHPGAGPALEQAGFRPAGCLPDFSSAALLREWGDSIAGKRLQVLIAEDTSPALLADLAAGGAFALPVPAYRYSRSWLEPPVVPDLIVASSSAGVSLVLGRPEFRGIRVAAIGPRTAEAARSLGAEVHVADPGGADGLIQLAIDLLATAAGAASVAVESACLPPG